MNLFELSNGKIKILTLRYLLLYKHFNKSIKYNFVKRKWVNRMKNRIFCKSLVAGGFFQLNAWADCADLWGGTG